MLLFSYKLPERKEKMFTIISNGKDALIKNGGVEIKCHLRYEVLSYEEEWEKIKEKIRQISAEKVVLLKASRGMKLEEIIEK